MFLNLQCWQCYSMEKSAWIKLCMFWGWSSAVLIHNPVRTRSIIVCVFFSLWRFRCLHLWATISTLALGSSPLQFANLLLVTGKSSPFYLGRGLWLCFSPASMEGETFGLSSESDIRKFLKKKVVREVHMAKTIYIVDITEWLFHWNPNRQAVWVVRDERMIP